MSNEVRNRIASNLRTIAKARGVAQVSIAKACGVSKGAVSNWFKGLNSIDLEYIPTIASMLGVSVDVLLGSEVDADTAALLGLLSSMDSESRNKVLSFAMFIRDRK